MPQSPIPSDWDGVSWCCHVIEWPDSPEWLYILSGLLLSPTQGRYWDASTGSIIGAQAVGEEIETRNCLYQEDT